MMTKEEKREAGFLKMYFKAQSKHWIPLTPGMQIRHFDREKRLRFLLNQERPLRVKNV